MQKKVMNIHNYDSNSQINQDELNVSEIWRIIRSSRKSILAIFVTVLAITIYRTFTIEPIYQSTTVVMIREDQADPSSFVLDFGLSGSKQRLQNEIEVLKSYYLHDKVVQSLIDDGSANSLSLFGTRTIARQYRIWESIMNWIKHNETLAILPGDLLYSEKVKIVDELRDLTKITPVREADVVKIAVNSTDSSEAVFLANRISNIYRSLDLKGGQGELHFVLTFLDEQITKYEERLAIVEDELEKFQSKHQIYSLDGTAELLLLDLTEYESIYYTNVAEYEVAQERVNYLKGQLSESEKALMEEITNTNNPMIVALRGKIADLEAQKVQQMVDEGWNDESMQARDYNRRIFEMKSKLTTITESLILSGWSEEDPFGASQEIFNKIVEQEVEVHSAASRAKEYKKLVDQMSTRLTKLPSQTLEYTRLERELQLNEKLYITMKQKYEESRITEAGQMGKVRILDPAIISEKVKPNKKLYILIGIILGISMGGGYAFAVEFLDKTIKSVEQLARKGIVVIGIIPDMHHMSDKMHSKKIMAPSKGGTDFRRRLITYEDPKSPVSESYRSLRTNIAYSAADKKIKSLLVSSPQPGEGKSTTTANLAIAFAQLRKRTLLIDADLRKPVQHNVFDQKRGPGLAEYLVGDIIDFDSLIHPTKVENLYIVTAGGLPPNPSELLGSAKMSELVDRLEDQWDMILFDSPPIVAVTDASMISAEIDGIAMVIKAGQTDRAAVDRALDTIKNVQAPLIGAILNGANPGTLAGKYSYYYSYYNYYYSDQHESENESESNLSS
jgi:capsular exopolysaccharide synthesis family protein